MGQLETESRKRTRKKNLELIILGTVKAAGLLTVAAFAPNALQAFYKRGLVPGTRQRESITSSRKRLVEKGYLEYQGTFLRLTSKGEKVLMLLEAKEFRLKKPKKWDKKWRVLIFDISEKRRGTRDKIRATLHSIGFMKLQNSVWIYPYDCEDLITLLKADFKIGKDLLYMIVESLEYDTWVKKYFGLR